MKQLMAELTKVYWQFPETGNGHDYCERANAGDLVK